MVEGRRVEDPAARTRGRGAVAGARRGRRGRGPLESGRACISKLRVLSCQSWGCAVVRLRVLVRLGRGVDGHGGRIGGVEERAARGSVVCICVCVCGEGVAVVYRWG
jgi:hypothetical protein